MSDGAAPEVVFREVQRFRQVWVWLMIAIVPVACIIAIVDMAAFNEAPGLASASGIGTLVICTIVGIGIPGLMFTTQLITEVRQDGIYYRYIPFHRTFRGVPNDIVRAEIRKYHPLREYGGWGIRGWRWNRACNVSGDIGLQLEFANGGRLLIGTHQPDALMNAIRSVYQW